VRLAPPLDAAPEADLDARGARYAVDVRWTLGFVLLCSCAVREAKPTANVDRPALHRLTPYTPADSPLLAAYPVWPWEEAPWAKLLAPNESTTEPVIDETPHDEEYKDVNHFWRDPRVSDAATFDGPGSQCPRQFDLEVTARVVRAIATNLGSCKRQGGPTGEGHAVMTFANDGHVTEAWLDDITFTATDVGTCALQRLVRARTTPFSCGTVSVATHFKID
jgi:hypothetical protein